MRRKSKLVIAILVFEILISNRAMANQPPSDLQALLSVIQPLFQAGGATKQELLFHFKLLNIGSRKIDPRIESSKIIINGKKLEASGFILSNGPRDTRWHSLPPGDTLEFTYVLEDYFQEPGEYRVAWKGNNFESPTVMFRVLADVDMHRNAEPQLSLLTAKIVVPDELRFIDGSAEGSLVLKNISPETVRICTKYHEWRSVSGNNFWVRLKPDVWKSDAPPSDVVARHCVNLQPSEQIALPFHIFEIKSETLRISAAYEIGASFAGKYKTWAGVISAEPLVVRVRTDVEGYKGLRPWW